MRLPTSRNQRRPLRVEMTPMIDVVFLLLIFFLWTSSFQIAEQLLPSAVAQESAVGGNTRQADESVDFENVVVRIQSTDGIQWIVNGRVISTWAEVANSLSAITKVKPDIPVVVDPESTVPLGDVIDLYDLARQLGCQQVRFAAPSPEMQP